MLFKLIFWAFLLRSRRATGYDATHALRMPNAYTQPCMYARIRVRDSSEKPAVSEANEVQAWHATSLPAYSPTPKRKRRGHAHKIYISISLLFLLQNYKRTPEIRVWKFFFYS